MTLARDESHLVVRALREALDRVGASQVGLEIRATNRIPHGKGLGSSAAAVVAGVIAARAMIAEPEALDAGVALQIATAFEGHPDNAAPAIYGGATVAWVDAAGPHASQLVLAQSIETAVLIPESVLPTKTARSVLPPQVPHSHAAFNVGRAALLVNALAGRPEDLLAATEDKLHQPYRADVMAASHSDAAALARSGPCGGRVRGRTVSARDGPVAGRGRVGDRRARVGAGGRRGEVDVRAHRWQRRGRRLEATVTVRAATLADAERLAHICLVTGAAGSDATGLFSNDATLADVYATPYVRGPGCFALVWDADGEATGYVVGTTDTVAFQQWFVDDWWPQRAALHPPRTAGDAWLLPSASDPRRMLVPQVAEYPAHLHIDLLPSQQRKGAGRQLIDAAVAHVRDSGVAGVHLVAERVNHAAQAFYPRVGFIPVAEDETTVTFGRLTGA